MKLFELIEFLNNELDLSIEDSSNNGLQVGTDKEIKKIGFAVDANLETFKKAKENKCDLLIVHHGISWNDSLKHITGNNYDRVGFLIENNLALVAYHLPLDCHKVLGNNIQIAQLLGLRKVKPFDVGFVGELRQDLDPETMSKALENILKTKCKNLFYGKNLIHSVAIISGGAGRDIEDASKIADCFITGEINYGHETIAKEVKINVIVAGHYETETLGLKALMKFLNRKTDSELVFIESY